MTHVTVDLPDGGDVEISALNYLSDSWLHIEDAYTSWRIGDFAVKASRGRIEAFVKGELVYERAV